MLLSSPHLPIPCVPFPGYSLRHHRRTTHQRKTKSCTPQTVAAKGRTVSLWKYQTFIDSPILNPFVVCLIRCLPLSVSVLIGKNACIVQIYSDQHENADQSGGKLCFTPGKFVYVSDGDI